MKIGGLCQGYSRFGFIEVGLIGKTCLTLFRMSPGIRDQLLLLVDEVETITDEVFDAVQNGNQAENLLEMLIKKDRELAQLLLVAKSQKQLHQSICEHKEEVSKYNARIERFQAKLLEAESDLLPALYQAKERLEAIREAEEKQIAAEDIVKYSHKISACHATCAPSDWQPGSGDPRRPYPTDVDMRAGILPQITVHGTVQQLSHDIPRPPAQLGTDGEILTLFYIVLLD